MLQKVRAISLPALCGSNTLAKYNLTLYSKEDLYSNLTLYSKEEVGYYFVEDLGFG